MSRARSAALKFREAAPVFAALGEPTRLTLVAKLCADGPQSIARLSEGIDVTRQAVTKHARSGRERVCELETARLDKARRCLDQISDQSDTVLERLRVFVEENPR